MKKIMIMILLLAFLLSGCSLWMDGEYHSVKPHASDGTKLADDKVTVSGYQELRDALVEMVTSGRQQTTFYITGFELEEVDQYMNTAVMHVFQNSAIGAYAVDEITFDSGISGGIAAIAVDVSYIHGRQEILRIKRTNNMDGVQSLVKSALHDCEGTAVIRVDQYDERDLAQFVRDYVESNPHLCMEIPQVSVSVYPNRGEERVLEINFTYQTSRETLRSMQDIVSPIFSAAQMYVQNSDGESQKYEQLYSFLMERFDYRYETSITPAYSLLRYGVGDSKAFAMVFGIMCQNAELSCDVVSGTKNGEAYYWNVISIDGVLYHVDLLACNEAGEFLPVLPDEMSGYVWDYSEFE